MADKKIKHDIKQVFYELADELEKKCGEWECLPNDEELTKRILFETIIIKNRRKIKEKD